MLQQEEINTAHKWRQEEANCHEVVDHHIQLNEMCLTTRLDKIL